MSIVAEIRTEGFNILICQVVILNDGTRALRIKRGKHDDYEVMHLEEFLAKFYAAA
ncbi:MAG: hypothetical protein IJV40_06470 [Oscillospiraceae bacterium]|nr:hypothetical protein [Oscillospiraceae bacterium]